MSEWKSHIWGGLLDLLPGGGTSAPGEGLEITLEHSWPWSPWVTLLGLIVLIAAVIVIYLREKPQAGVRRYRVVLTAIRIAAVALAVFLMYGWMQRPHRTDLPDLVVVVDDSLSMGVRDAFKDPRTRRQLARWVESGQADQPTRLAIANSLLLDERRGWLEELAQRYRVKLYLIGESARSKTGDLEEIQAELEALDAEGTASRLGEGLQRGFEAQRGRATAAVVVLTDGITTAGMPISEAAELARRKAIPLYLVGLGNDEPPQDVRLSDLLVDDNVFVGDLVNFDVRVHSQGYEGESAVAQLTRAGSSEVLARQRIELPGEGSSRSVRLSVRPEEEGTVEYQVELLPLEGEVNRENNRLTRRVEVHDVAIRVLLVQEYPSYEFRFLKDLLSRLVRHEGARDKLVELTTVLQEADLEYTEQDATATSVFPVGREALFSYDVVLFGDVNPESLSRSVMENLVEFVKAEGGGVVFLPGPRFTPLAYRDTPLAELMPVDLATVSAPPADAPLVEPSRVQLTALGKEAPQVQLGDSPEETARIWRGLPGVHWLLEAPDLRPAARVLVERPPQAGAAGTGLPVICMQFVGAGKVVFHATDETYRWSRYGGDDTYYARYWLQTLRYLGRTTLFSDEQSAEILTDRQEYRQGDPVKLTVRFLDERLAPAENAGVQMVIEQEDGRRRQLRMHRRSTARGEFTGRVSDLGAGEHRAWIAAPSLPDPPSPHPFTVRPPSGEQLQLEMDSADLKTAAERSRGRFYTAGTAHRLPEELPRGRQVRIESLPPEPIWNSPFFAATLVGLLTAEWLLRKRARLI